MLLTAYRNRRELRRSQVRTDPRMDPRDGSEDGSKDTFMTRRPFAAIAFGVMAFGRVAFGVIALASGEASAEQLGQSCLYNGRLYSDGALICVQKSLMLGCSFDGVHAAWKPVMDQSLESRCQTPSISAYSPPHRHRHHIHAARYRV